MGVSKKSTELETCFYLSESLRDAVEVVRPIPSRKRSYRAKRFGNRRYPTFEGAISAARTFANIHGIKIGIRIVGAPPRPDMQLRIAWAEKE